MKKHSKYFLSQKKFLFYQEAQLFISCQCRQTFHTISKSSHLTSTSKTKRSCARRYALQMFIKST